MSLTHHHAKSQFQTRFAHEMNGALNLLQHYIVDVVTEKYLDMMWA